ncbi:MAG: DUF5050 domain-containing protein [Oscillospiraceae bacterium]|jgi:hypothetical protein|nr:DUF5050 domain-containing protein [Oscillospiraceae bacterium]
MLKKALLVVLVLVLLSSSVAMADMTNRDMQLMGGVVVSNLSDSFFFCPMEEGLTRHWGLYKLSTANEKPIVEITDGIPARLVHADDTHVYFMAYSNAERTIHELYSVNIETGENKRLLDDIKSAFVEDSDTFLFVTSEKPCALRRYDIPSGKDTLIKDMTQYDKEIYDASVYNGDVYFLTVDPNGVEDGYRYYKDNNRARLIEKPKSFSIHNSMLYEGYRIYANDTQNSRIYALKLGSKNSAPMGTNYSMSLSTPRFGDAMFNYSGENMQLVRLPLDGSVAEQTLTLEGNNVLSRLIIGGYSEEILLYNNGGIYAIEPDMSGQTRLFDFDLSTGAQVWCYLAQGRNNSIFVMGYGTETFTHNDNMPPTGVYVYDRTTGEQLFGFPETTIEEAINNADPLAAMGDVPPPEAEGETQFVF